MRMDVAPGQPTTRRARPHERGASAIQYALILAVIAGVTLGAVRSFGEEAAFTEDSDAAQATEALEGDAPPPGEVSDSPTFNAAAAGVRGNEIQTNGFEDGSTRNWTNYGVGDKIGDWTVIEGNVDTHDTTAYQFGDAARAIDLNGFSAGAIEQTFDVVPGVVYDLTMMVGENQCGPAAKSMAVEWNGNEVARWTVDLPKGEYEQKKIRLPQATTSSATLTIRSLTPTGVCGPQIDLPTIQLAR